MGLAVWPTPQICEFGNWVRDRFEQRQLIDDGAHRSLTELEERELWRQCVRDDPPANDTIDIESAALHARRAYRTMTDYLIPTESLRAFPSDESTLLERWIRAFERSCGSLDVANSAARMHALPADMAPPMWIESAAWRPIARGWLERRSAKPLPPLAAIRPAEPVLSEFSTPPVELAAAAAWARANLEEHAGFRAWIYIANLDARRDEVERTFDAALAGERFRLSKQRSTATYAIAGGTPLIQHSPVAFAFEALESAFGTVSFDAFSRLLRARELSGEDTEESVAAALEFRLRAHAPNETSLAGWIAITARIGERYALIVRTPLQRLRIIEQELNQQRAAQPLSAWAARWRRALDAGPWAGRASWSSREFQAAQRLRELIDSLARADVIYGGLTGPNALRVLKRSTRETDFQPQTGVPAVWITGQAVDPWLSYDGIWIADASSRNWPPPVNPVPLIPIRLQRQYGIAASSAPLQLRAAQTLQSQWLRRATQKVFSYAREDVGEHRQPSILVLGMSRMHALTAPSLHRHWERSQEGSLILETFFDERGPALAVPLARPLNVSSLREQSLCAFRGFASTRLRLKPFDIPVAGFNRMERGNLLHDALHAIWLRLQNLDSLLRLTAESRTEILSQAVDAALDRQRTRRDADARWVARERRRMLALLDRWLEIEARRAPFAVRYLEHERRIVLPDQLEFSFRIDRVDRLGDGQQVVIDYKTGVSKNDWANERPRNPQLALYAHSIGEPLAAVAYAQIVARESGFVAMVENPAIFGTTLRRANPEGGSVRSQLEIWMRRIERIAAELQAGHAAVDPLTGACNSCHFEALCRIDAQEPEDGAGEESE